jgi:hypothetical protein
MHFQLSSPHIISKGQQSRIGNQINVIQTGRTPNFYFLQYDLATWRVKNLLLVPSFAFPPSAIIKRRPLSSTARRAGWIGCNIALNRVPVEARIAIVTTIASSRRRTGVAPVSDLRISAVSAGFPGPPKQHRMRIEAFEDGDRRDACPTQTGIASPAEVRAQFRRVKPFQPGFCIRVGVSTQAGGGDLLCGSEQSLKPSSSRRG